MRRSLVEDAMLAQSLSDMEAFWAIRDASAEIEPVLGDHESFDVGLPPGEVGRFVEACRYGAGARAACEPGGVLRPRRRRQYPCHGVGAPNPARSGHHAVGKRLSTA